MFCGIHLRAISQELFFNLIRNLFIKYTLQINTAYRRGKWVKLRQIVYD